MPEYQWTSHRLQSWHVIIKNSFQSCSSNPCLKNWVTQIPGRNLVLISKCEYLKQKRKIESVLIIFFKWHLIFLQNEMLWFLFYFFAEWNFVIFFWKLKSCDFFFAEWNVVVSIHSKIGARAVGGNRRNEEIIRYRAI